MEGVRGQRGPAGEKMFSFWIADAFMEQCGQLARSLTKVRAEVGNEEILSVGASPIGSAERARCGDRDICDAGEGEGNRVKSWSRSSRVTRGHTR